MTKQPTPAMDSSTDFLLGGGEMGERMRAMDWSETALGPVALWPQSLKTAIRIMLTSRQPMFVWWGGELINLYNDAYKAIVGGKHPDALGQPAARVWREIWDQIAPRAASAVLDNKGTYDEALLLIMERNGYPEETYYTFSYSPIPNDRGGTGGILCANTDDTRRIIGERQLALLRELAATAAEARTVEEACALAANGLRTNLRDLPFTLLYRVDPEHGRVRLAGASGLEGGHPWAPETAALGDASPWPFAEAVKTRQICLVKDLDARGESLPAGAWPRPPRQAVAVPIAASGQADQAGPAAILIAGLNPFRLFDDGYKGFISLVAGQLAASLANAQASEAERKRAEALAELDRAKTTFFSNISHEFRTPLSLLLGPLDDVLARPEGLIPPEDRELLTLARRNGQRLLKLVNTLLDFSRIEAGRIQAVYEPVDLAAYTAELASVFRAAVERAGLRLLIDCPKLQEPAYVDRDMWEKIVLNLVSNAFKYTLEGEIRVSLRGEKGAAVLRVSDTGLGIPEAELPKIFQRFHRVEGMRGRTQEGTGIGLALVQELARLHRGKVEVASRCGKGSTFTVAVPLGREHLPPDRIGGDRTLASTALGAVPFVEEALRWLPETESAAPLPMAAGLLKEAPSPLPAVASRARIVLADDNADLRYYLKRLLSSEYEVIAVADGQQALRATAKVRPDLVLTDVMMPNLDGFGLLRELRAEPATASVPLILLSARAGEEARVEGLRAGADDYLVKPFSAKELLARIGGTLALARARREATRREEELRAETVNVLENMADGFMAFDCEWRIAYVNAVAERITGLPRTGLLGRRFWEVFPSARGTHAERELRRVMAERTPARFEVFCEPYGRWFESAAYPTRDGGIAAYARDVTERKRAEERLRQSEERLRKMFQVETVGVVFFDLSGTLVEANDAFLRLTGYTRDDVQARQLNWRTLTPPEWADVSAEQMKRFEVTGHIGPYEKEYFHKDGSRSWLLFAGASLDDGTIVKFCIDVTARKRAEEALHEADRRKDEFLAMLAHELRNPLAPIRTGVQILRLARDKPDTLESAMDMMERQLRHMVRLIDDLLDLSRISRGKIELRKAPVDLATIIQHALETSRPLIAQSGHELILSLPAEPIIVEADVTRLAQAFANLLNNAAKYTESGGRISLIVERCEGGAVVRVKDTGVGIPSHMLARVFDIFTQVDRSLERAQGGLGIGLSLVKGLVEMHGGSVEAHSEGHGRGSELVVRLKALASPAQEAFSRAEESAGAWARRRVLVVDDNVDAATSLSILAEIMGHEVRTAHNGLEALDTAATFRPDLILLDIGMPKLNGYDACRRIRAEPWGRDIVIAALTGWGQEEDKRRSWAAGFNHHLVKPVDPLTLRKLLALLPGKPAGHSQPGFLPGSGERAE